MRRTLFAAAASLCTSFAWSIQPLSYVDQLKVLEHARRTWNADNCAARVAASETLLCRSFPFPANTRIWDEYAADDPARTPILRVDTRNRSWTTLYFFGSGRFVSVQKSRPEHALVAFKGEWVPLAQFNEIWRIEHAEYW